MFRFKNALFSLGMFPLAVGCQSTYRTRPVEVLVRDAESRQPISNAEVQIIHHHTASDVARATTGPSGIATVDFVPNGAEPAMISVSGKGIRDDFKVVSDTEIIKVAPKPLFGSAGPHEADFVVDVYSDPPFDIVLVLPAGYKGLVRADINLKDESFEKGRRAFSFTADAKGEVTVKGPKVLDRVAIVNYHARYEGEEQMFGEMTDKTVGIRWLKKDGTRELFVVGTQAEFEQFRKELVPQQNPNERSADAPKKSGRGGGGGGRRGGGGGGGGR